LLKTNNGWNFSELAREKMWARIYLTPVLQAEEDRDQVRRYLADQEREKQLLGKVTKVYHSDRYASLQGFLMAFLTVNSRFVKPTYGVIPNTVSK
jgi:hypothetical protein